MKKTNLATALFFGAGGLPTAITQLIGLQQRRVMFCLCSDRTE